MAQSPTNSVSRAAKRRGWSLCIWATEPTAAGPCPLPLLSALLGFSSFPPSFSLISFPVYIFSFLLLLRVLIALHFSSPKNAIYTPACRTSHKHGRRDSSTAVRPPPTPQGPPNPPSHRHPCPQPWHSVLLQRQLRFRVYPFFHYFRRGFFRPPLPQQTSIPP